MSETINAIKRFKKYEALSFGSFFFASVIFFYQDDWLASVISLCAAVWVFTSAGNRQNFEDAIEVIKNGQ